MLKDLGDVDLKPVFKYWIAKTAIYQAFLEKTTGVPLNDLIILLGREVDRLLEAPNPRTNLPRMKEVIERVREPGTQQWEERYGNRNTEMRRFIRDNCCLRMDEQALYEMLQFFLQRTTGQFYISGGGSLSLALQFEAADFPGEADGTMYVRQDYWDRWAGDISRKFE